MAGGYPPLESKDRDYIFSFGIDVFQFPICQFISKPNLIPFQTMALFFKTQPLSTPSPYQRKQPLQHGRSAWWRFLRLCRPSRWSTVAAPYPRRAQIRRWWFCPGKGPGWNEGKGHLFFFEENVRTENVEILKKFSRWKKFVLYTSNRLKHITVIELVKIQRTEKSQSFGSSPFPGGSLGGWSLSQCNGGGSRTTCFSEFRRG